MIDLFKKAQPPQLVHLPAITFDSAPRTEVQLIPQHWNFLFTVDNIQTSFMMLKFMPVIIAMALAISLVSADTVVNLLLGDSSIGESDIRLRGKVVGSIVGVVRLWIPSCYSHDWLNQIGIYSNNLWCSLRYYGLDCISFYNTSLRWGWSCHYYSRLVDYVFKSSVHQSQYFTVRTLFWDHLQESANGVFHSAISGKDALSPILRPWPVLWSTLSAKCL